jgi:hypothetical protein
MLAKIVKNENLFKTKSLPRETRGSKRMLARKKLFKGEAHRLALKAKLFWTTIQDNRRNTCGRF